MAEASVSFAGNLAALHRHARDPHRPSSPWGSASDETDITTARRSPDLSVVMGRWPTPADENGSAAR
jgi:hypothetical protein